MSFLNTLVLSYVWKAKVAVKSESNVCSFNHDLKKKNVNHVHRLRCCLFNVHALKWSAAGHTARMRSCDLISWYMLKGVLVCSGGRAADRHTLLMESLEGLPTWPTQWGKQNSSAAPPETSVELQRVPSPYLKKIKRENVRRGSLWCCLPLHEDLVYCRLVPLDRSHNEIPARTTESRRPRSSLSCEEKMEEWEEVVPRRTEKKTTQTKRVIKVRHRNVFKPPGVLWEDMQTRTTCLCQTCLFVTVFVFHLRLIPSQEDVSRERPAIKTHHFCVYGEWEFVEMWLNLNYV